MRGIVFTLFFIQVAFAQEQVHPRVFKLLNENHSEFIGRVFNQAAYIYKQNVLQRSKFIGHLESSEMPEKLKNDYIKFLEKKTRFSPPILRKEGNSLYLFTGKDKISIKYEDYRNGFIAINGKKVAINSKAGAKEKLKYYAPYFNKAGIPLTKWQQFINFLAPRAYASFRKNSQLAGLVLSLDTLVYALESSIRQEYLAYEKRLKELFESEIYICQSGKYKEIETFKSFNRDTSEDKYLSGLSLQNCEDTLALNNFQKAPQLEDRRMPASQKHAILLCGRIKELSSCLYESGVSKSIK